MRSYITWRKLAQALLFTMLCLNLYRGFTQSLTTDEAFTYQNFVSKRYAGLFAHFDANNHVLNSILSRISVAVFGLREWSLRLPSISGSALYLFATYQLCFLVFGGGAWSFVTTALLTTNPFLLDHLSAARGYGLGLGFLMVGVYTLVSILEGEDSRTLYLPGICFGLAISANLTFVFPIAAVIIAFFLVTAASGNLKARHYARQLLVPLLLVSLILLAAPLSRAQPQAFYFGAKRLHDTIQSLIDVSFSYDSSRFNVLGSFSPSSDRLRFGIVLIVQVVFWLSVIYAVLGLRSLYHARQEKTHSVLYFFTGSFALALSLIVAAHYAANVLYPLTRTGLYLIPLTLLAASALLYAFRKSRLLRYAGGALAGFCLMSFLAQANVSYYMEWRFDAGTKRIVNFIRSQSLSNRQITVRTSWVLEPTLNFYRLLYSLNWKPVDRSGFDNPGDIFILISTDQDWIGKLRLKVIYRDTASGTIVGVPLPDG